MFHPTDHPGATGNPIGVHAQLWGLGWAPDVADRAVHQSAAAGFDLIEIPATPVPVARFDATARLLDAAGIAASVSLALPDDADIAGEDDAAVTRGERLLLHAIDFAAAIGARYVGGVTYSRMGLPTGPVSARGLDYARRTLARVAATAERHGITVGLECINRYETALLNTTAQASAFIETIGAPNLAVHIDTYHANVEERDLRDAVLGAGGRLAYVHASENHRGVLGTGSIDWPTLFRAFAETGFDGPITVETFSNAVLDERTSSDLGLWRTLWADPFAAAVQARQFIRAQLDAAASPHTPAQPTTTPQPRKEFQP